jgi:hypothetical protein
MSTDTILLSNNETNQMYKTDGVGLGAGDKNTAHLIEPYGVGRMSIKASTLKDRVRKMGRGGDMIYDGCYRSAP